MPEISIIVPVYNVEIFLARCIESILYQSFKNFELLLIDDGSTDKSLQICQYYCSTDSRVIVIHQSNQGVTKARERGWIESKGNWIVFVDADDIFINKGLEILFTEASNNKCEIINACMQSQPYPKLWVHKKMGILNRCEYINTLINNQTLAIPVASIYKKDIFQKSTFSFDPSIKIGEDVLMKIELARRVTRVKNIPDIIYYYQTNENSATNQKVRHPDYFEKYYKIINNLLTGFEHSLSDETVLILDNEKTKAILYSIFSPHMKFSIKSLKDIKDKIPSYQLSYSQDYKTYIYSKAIKSIFFIKILKEIIYIRYIIVSIIKKRKITKKEILY